MIGKGIVRFHAVIWPAILLSAGLPAADRAVRARLRDGQRPQDRQVARQCRRSDRPRRTASASTRSAGGCCARCRASAKPTSPRPASSRPRTATSRTASATSCSASLGLGATVSAPGAIVYGRRLSQSLRRGAIDAAIAAFDLRAATGAIIAEIDAAEPVHRARRSPGRCAATRGRGVLDDLARATRAIVDELRAVRARPRRRARPLGSTALDRASRALVRSVHSRRWLISRALARRGGGR